MNEDTAMYFDNTCTSGTSYLESLIKARSMVLDCPKLIEKIEKVISAELDLALMGANKAISEITKDIIKNNVKAIK